MTEMMVWPGLVGVRSRAFGSLSSAITQFTSSLHDSLPAFLSALASAQHIKLQLQAPTPTGDSGQSLDGPASGEGTPAGTDAADSTEGRDDRETTVGEQAKASSAIFTAEIASSCGSSLVRTWSCYFSC